MHNVPSAAAIARKESSLLNDSRVTAAGRACSKTQGTTFKVTLLLSRTRLDAADVTAKVSAEAPHACPKHRLRRTYVFFEHVCREFSYGQCDKTAIQGRPQSVSADGLLYDAFAA